MIRRPPRSTLFPYTTLFRSHGLGAQVGRVRLDEEPVFVHEAQNPGRLAVFVGNVASEADVVAALDRKSTRLNSSHANISYAVFCLKKKKTNIKYHVSRLLLF